MAADNDDNVSSLSIPRHRQSVFFVGMQVATLWTYSLRVRCNEASRASVFSSVEIDGPGLLSHIDIIHATRFILLYRNNYYSQTAPTALLLLVLPTAQCAATLLRSRPSA